MKKLLICRRNFGAGLPDYNWSAIDELHTDNDLLQKCIQHDDQHWYQLQHDYILETVKLLSTKNLTVFLFAGWAIGVLNGKKTHPHIDIDSLIYQDLKQAIKQTLEANGYITKDKGSKLQIEKNQVEFHADVIEQFAHPSLSSQSLIQAVSIEINHQHINVVNPHHFLSWLQYKYQHNFGNLNQNTLPEKTKSGIKVLERYIERYYAKD